MSFPNVIYGDYGDEKYTQATRIGSLPLGTLMVLPDGRQFRHARAHTAKAISAGYLYSTQPVTAGTGYEKSIACTAAVGATSVVVTADAGTAIVASHFKDGYLFVASSTGSGLGYTYKITDNTAAAAASTSTVSLAKGDEIKVAIGGTTAAVGMRINQFDDVEPVPNGTALYGKIAGIAPMAESALGSYFWVQRSGPALAFVGGTVLAIGDPVFCSSAVAGLAAAYAGTAAADSKTNVVSIGYGLTVSEIDGYSLIDLDLE